MEKLTEMKNIVAGVVLGTAVATTPVANAVELTAEQMEEAIQLCDQNGDGQIKGLKEKPCLRDYETYLQKQETRRIAIEVQKQLEEKFAK